MDTRRLRARYDGTCSTCGHSIAAGDHAWWNKATKTLTCMDCGSQPDATSTTRAGSRDSDPASPDLDRGDAAARIVKGSAGASAQQEYERRRAKRERKVRDAHPILGGLILAVTDEPQSTKAWAKGAEGERRIGRRLDQLEEHGCVVLHDRRIPGTRANIDHLVVASNGIWVIDAKFYKGRVAKRDVGGWFKSDLRLYVGRRDCTKLLAGMTFQVSSVEKALGGDIGSTLIRPVLCFTDAEWGWFASPFKLDGVLVSWPKATLSAVKQPGELSAERVTELGSLLAERLPPAT